MLQQPKILLVTGNGPETDRVRELLERHAALACAGSIPKLRSLIRKTHYDALFCPPWSPAGSWEDVLELVEEEAPGLPIIVLSSQGNERDWLEALDVGVFDWLTLPVPPQSLLAIVEQAAASREARARWTGTIPAVLHSGPG
jgi:DNA-binding NtrC family response regulator